MIKCSDDVMLIKLEKLFNKIFKTGFYSKFWNEGLIFSKHKSGEKENPNNYRGITFSNGLGKLFNTILQNRLTTKLQNANILSPAQAGFRKGHRTSDHISTLFSLIRSYFTKDEYLYTCFVYFQKAYHSIWRDGLKDKLVIADTSNGNNEKPKLEDTSVISSLFADDLAIFSLSLKELQNKINILEECCYNWGLELNIKKTKIVILNKQGANIKKFKFYYRDKEIEIAKQYTYLEFTFTPSGKK